MISIVALLVTIPLVWFALKPHLYAHSLENSPESAEVTTLLDQKARCLQVLKDLELDFNTNKINAADYQQMQLEVSQELAVILERLDAGGGGA